MSSRKTIYFRLLITFAIATSTFLPVSVHAAAATHTARETYKSGSVVPSENAAAMRKAAQENATAAHYITDGKKLDKAVARLRNIDPKATGLDPSATYSYRMDKLLTGNYFYHVKAFLPGNSAPAGDFLLARDDSCVYRRIPGEDRMELLEGSSEKLLKEVEIYAAYKKIPLDGVGKVLTRVPGNVPYKLTLTSLNENTLTIKTDDNGQPLVYGVARGKADVLAEIEIGNFATSKAVTFTVLDEKDLAREENRSSGRGFPIGIGIGWGRGHHHHSGGIAIGI